MGIIASNGYLASFSLGTIIGATSIYYLLRHSNKNKKPEVMPQEEMFEVRLYSDLKVVHIHNIFKYTVSRS